jgi:hypothetical protein
MSVLLPAVVCRLLGCARTEFYLHKRDAHPAAHPNQSLPAGMPNSKTGAKGNLRIRFQIEFPRKQLGEAERRQLEALLAGKT